MACFWTASTVKSYYLHVHSVLPRVVWFTESLTMFFFYRGHIA